MALDRPKHLHRLFQLYILIQGDPGWNAPKLAERFGTNVRTIFRDIGLLRSAGIPIDHDPERRCFCIRRDFFMPPLALTFGEALALLSCGRQIHDGAQIPFTQPALKALAKIRGQLPGTLIRQLDQFDEQVSVRLAASSTQEAFEEFYDLIRRAIAMKTRLRCRYESATNASKSGRDAEAFQFDPYTLMFSQRAWYAVGLHHGHSEVRTLKLNRFSEITSTETLYSIPREFSLQAHLGNAWRMIRGRVSYDVELVFDPQFSENITDTVWHPTQSYRYLNNGSLLWNCTVDGLEEILWWVLSMGSHCRVVKPVELVAQVREETSKALAMYSSPGHLEDATKVQSAIRTKRG